MINRCNKMNLDCLNDIISDNLAIHIDLTDINSWDLNSGLTSYSLTKWSGAKSDNIDLLDWGLTAFDNGRTNEMWSSFNFKPSDTLFSMYRVGYNEVQNPTTGETSGVTVTTEYLPIFGITSGTSGNYFELAGGYLQGFFKLDGYNYELFPSRYNEGITIETLVYLYPESEGIFYLMGTRAEDKYNPYFSGETFIDGMYISGVTTSEDHYLEAIQEKEVMKDGFSDYADRNKTVSVNVPQSGNIINNIIAFEITSDKKLGYKYVDGNNQVITNKSIRSINPTTGWTMITIVFTPDGIIDDPDVLECAPARTGEFKMCINGRPIWTVPDFPEYFFKRINNDREKQIGVPYSISWGGGSFGLKNSWHYDIQTYGLYTSNDQNYINEYFDVESRPFPDQCDPVSGGTLLNGLSLSADSTTFKQIDVCDSSIEYPVTTMKIRYTGVTSGVTANTYYVKYDKPISVLSNREYEISANLFIEDLFNTYDQHNNMMINKISFLIYGTEDIDIIEESEFVYPLTSSYIEELPGIEENKFDDEYSYVKNGVSYYGETGLPVYSEPAYYRYYGVDAQTQEELNGTVITGLDKWLPIKTKFKVKDNSGQQIIYVGILIQTSYVFNLNGSIFVNDLKYKGADILNQDSNKDGLLVQQNFDSSFNGKIQKLRIYDRSLNSQEVLHNALIESRKNPNLNLLVSKGGRIIYR